MATPSDKTSVIEARLRHLYDDVCRLSTISAPSLLLHPADRNLSVPPRPPLFGLAAAQQHEEALVAATGRTLVMEVESITVGSDGVFACVIGMLRAGTGWETTGREEEAGGDRHSDGVDGKEGLVQRGNSKAGQHDRAGDGNWRQGGQDAGEQKPRGQIAVPFCGVWRFDAEGRAVEHWENAADPLALAKWLRGE